MMKTTKKLQHELDVPTVRRDMAAPSGRWGRAAALAFALGGAGLCGGTAACVAASGPGPGSPGLNGHQEPGGGDVRRGAAPGGGASSRGGQASQGAAAGGPAAQRKTTEVDAGGDAAARTGAQTGHAGTQPEAHRGTHSTNHN
jgi:hypothetical protein